MIYETVRKYSRRPIFHPFILIYGVPSYSLPMIGGMAFDLKLHLDFVSCRCVFAYRPIEKAFDNIVYAYIYVHIFTMLLLWNVESHFEGRCCITAGPICICSNWYVILSHRDLLNFLNILYTIHFLYGSEIL